ncbi:MAG: FecR domain-containing protein [bacterium]|nr:FecR domain-containing protein [bacterium]
MRDTRDSYSTRTGAYSQKRSVTETLLEALSQTGIRPSFSQPARVRKNRSGQIALALGMLVAMAALGFVFIRAGGDPLPPSADPVAMLEIAQGTVWQSPAVLPAATRRGGSGLLTLAGGEAIHAGATIETSTASGRVALRLAGGQSMRLDAGTRVRVASSSDLVLERGAVYVDSQGRSSVEVRTTLGVVRDIGTQFEVRLMGGADDQAYLRVRVREGSVLLEHDQESFHATVGEEIELDAEGHLTRSTVPIHGPDWDWVLATAPAPNIAGQPLGVFLDWLGREGGWDVRFADQQTEQLASTVMLHGDIQNLTPAEASTMVLHGSGLDYSLQGHLLIVEPKASNETIEPRPGGAAGP